MKNLQPTFEFSKNFAIRIKSPELARQLIKAGYADSALHLSGAVDPLDPKAGIKCLTSVEIDMTSNGAESLVSVVKSLETGAADFRKNRAAIRAGQNVKNQKLDLSTLNDYHMAGYLKSWTSEVVTIYWSQVKERAANSEMLKAIKPKPKTK